jgi:hypothetical protein
MTAIVFLAFAAHVIAWIVLPSTREAAQSETVATTPSLSTAPALA